MQPKHTHYKKKTLRTMTKEKKIIMYLKSFKNVKTKNVSTEISQKYNIVIIC